MSFTLDETVTKVIIETMIVISHACRDIYMRIMVTLGLRTCLSNTYWQNWPFTSLKKRRLLATDTLHYGTIWLYYTGQHGAMQLATVSYGFCGGEFKNHIRFYWLALLFEIYDMLKFRKNRKLSLLKVLSLCGFRITHSLVFS